MQTEPRPKWQHALTRQRLDFIRQHLDKADAEIARMLGVCRQAVHSLRQRYKIAKVHALTQRQQRLIEQLRRLKPGYSAKAAASKLGITLERARMYGKLAGYRFLGVPAARHFHWQKRMESLPPLLTVKAVARKLGVTPGYAALLCHRHKYKVTIPGGWQRPRVPIRRWLRHPRHERWLASLKPPKP